MNEPVEVSEHIKKDVVRVLRAHEGKFITMAPICYEAFPDLDTITGVLPKVAAYVRTLVDNGNVEHNQAGGRTMLAADVYRWRG